MSAPNWQNVLDVLTGPVKTDIEARIAQAQAQLPFGVALAEADLAAIIEGALSANNLTLLRDSVIADFKELLTTGKGPIGGPDATLA